MRIALVSPYSWTYPGGVTRHIEALAEQFIDAGHHVRVLAPFDPPDTLSTRLHRGARPQAREMPDYLIPLGRTFGIPANGAVSNLTLAPAAIVRLRRELEQGAFDVVHVHEPVAPALSWDAIGFPGAARVGTFHCYSDNQLTNNFANLIGARWRLNHLQVRIAVSHAAEWTGKRFFGGRYRIIPNGVEVPEAPAAAPPADPARPLRIAFIGQAVERKGLPILLRAFEALRDHVPAELVLVGASEEDIEPLLLDRHGITALGKVSDEEKFAAVASADLLCAPSLGGESFGMILTEAFAQGTPVVASDIPGYNAVVRDGVDGVLVPRGDATALAETLRDLALDRERIAGLAVNARQRAERYAWPTVAAEVLEAYEDAIALAHAPGEEPARLRLGAKPADLEPKVRAARVPSLERDRPTVGRRIREGARRAGLGLAGVGGVALAWYALQKIGISKIGDTLLASSPLWVLIALGLMCVSMAVRGVAWHAILKAALPHARVRRADAMQGTFIGVLMSATLPARLGEPSRALIVARRTGRPREHLPVVLGTIVSQAMLNIFALVILGAIMFSTVDFFNGRHGALLAFAAGPVAALGLVLAAPWLLRGGLPSRFRRVQTLLAKVRDAVASVRDGLKVFRHPKLGSTATVVQLAAWALQALSCYTLLVALGLDHVAGFGAAAAVLFAVNVTAVLPVTPSNLGTFQVACVTVLHGAYHVGTADALGYGIILQAVEIATAFVMGAPALLKEGMSWKDVRLRAMHAAPVELPPLPGAPAETVAAEA
ncbi:MAG TPA: lysylphosphatidylglycerol synthase domain-containing protein [Solirubrobacteraceae bacterium]|nr:lysylphosphatidylglycerol synthase domain-containing protein [Solirubrobacteraceae bacterium]